MRLLHYMVAALVLLASVAQAQVICPEEQPCPVGYHETLVNCKVCVMDGYDLTRPTDTDACPIGTWLSPDGLACVTDGAVLKSDGSCYVFNDADACCEQGYHLVTKYSCCRDGFNLATDNDMCCTQRADGKCCPDKFLYSFDSGRCIPPKPTGVVVR